MRKGNFFLFQGRRRKKGLLKSNVPPEVCLRNKINKASNVFSSALVQQPNHIPESLNCLLAIEWFPQRSTLGTSAFCRKYIGWRYQSAHPTGSFSPILSTDRSHNTVSNHIRD